MDSEFYKTVIDNSPIGYAHHQILCNDKNRPFDYIFLDVNVKFEEYTGLKRELITGKKASDVVSREFYAEYSRIHTYGRVALKGEKVEFKQFFKSLKRWFKLNVFSEEKDYFTITMLDITTEIAQNVQAQKRFRNYFEKAPFGVFITDAKGICREVNENACTTTGFTKAELIGMDLFRLFPVTNKVKAFNHFKRIVVDGQASSEYEYITKNGKVRFWRISAVKLNEDTMLCFTEDITEKKAMEVESKNREEMLQNIIETLPIGLWYADKEGKLLQGNSALTKIWGTQTFAGVNDYYLFNAKHYPSGELIDPFHSSILDTMHKGISVSDEMLEIETFDRQKKIILNYTAPVKDDDGAVHGAIIVNQDITHSKQAEESLQKERKLLKTTLQSIGDGVIVTDQMGKITIVNHALEEISGWQQEEVWGRDFDEIFELKNERTLESLISPVKTVLETGDTIGLSNHTVLTRKDGKKVPIADSAAPLKDEKGNTMGVVMVIRDVEEERKKHEKILYLGYHDSLTGLYNRRFFDEEAARLDKEKNLPLSIIIGDVNGLKLTNDAFGHNMGDKLLKKMAETIKKACRSDDIIARWGGDEFIILLPHTTAQKADEICQRIKKLAEMVKMDVIDFSISVGYETKQYPEQDIQNIIKKAEDYMYRKKSIESQSMRGNTINTILCTLHEKNPMERMHSNRVRELCKNIGHALRLSEKEINDMEIIALMHDIGKIAIDDSILNKNGILNEKEWFEIKRHPEIGYRILNASHDMSNIANSILAHHEHYDGSGYPNHLSREDIPFQSRILSIADAYDAMTSERPYRSAMSRERALSEIRYNAGTHFDPYIAKVFIEQVARAIS